MGSNERDIGFFGAGIVFWDILLYSKSKLVFKPGFYGTRALSNRLTSNCMLNDSKIRHVSSDTRCQSVEWPKTMGSIQHGEGHCWIKRRLR